ncbi:unnamed protein product, partial [Didymodactylos carnosus]
HSGKISGNELKQVLNALNIQVSDNELKQFMSQLDSDGSGSIEFDEFCRVMGPALFKKYTREELYETFRIFDQDGNGYIQAKELELIFARMGKRMRRNDIDVMIKLLDTSGDGQISFDEFLKLFD